MVQADGNHEKLEDGGDGDECDGGDNDEQIITTTNNLLLLHSLSLVCVPPPQLVLQPPHGAHSFHPGDQILHP